MLVAVQTLSAGCERCLSRSADDDLTSTATSCVCTGSRPTSSRTTPSPLVACVWSSGHEIATRYPARYLFEFLAHHGMLQLTGSPTWYTVVGGSGRYVSKIRDSLRGPEVTAVRAVTREPDAVELHDSRGQLHTVDQVIIATHADQALAPAHRSRPSGSARRSRRSLLRERDGAAHRRLAVPTGEKPGLVELCDPRVFGASKRPG